MNFSKHRPIFLGLVSAVIGLFILACGSVGIYDPQATQVALQGTVGAMQATVVALEAANQATQVDPTPLSPPSPQIIVVTATPVDTATASPTPLSSDTATPVPTPLPMPTATSLPPTASRPAAVATLPTASPTAAPKNYAVAPVITGPEEGRVVEEGRDVTLTWTWNGVLGPGEYFDLKIRPDGQTRSAYIGWEQVGAHNFKADLPPGRYNWSVQILKGYYKNNGTEPEDRVFEAFLGPESKPRLLIIDKRPDDKTPESPRSESQADAPHPALPYGLLAGGLVFTAFAGVTRVTRKRVF